MTNPLKSLLPDIGAIVFFLLISLAYFFTPISQGLVLDGHDTTGGVGAGKEISEQLAATGEQVRWTNSIFGGMPTYQIAPSYDSAAPMKLLNQIYGLGTSGVLAYLFLYLLGFYILLRAFHFRPYLAALGAVMWAFSSYFLIIIAAGHIWKVLALAYLPPLVGGVLLCYRGKLWVGASVVALFSAFEMMANHVQMTYYYLFILLFIALAYGIASLLPRSKREGADVAGIRPTFTQWLRATAVIAVAGVLGVLVNASNLYHTYQYTSQSMRGGSELTATDGKKTASGLKTDYITNWSYGIGESLTLLIPDFKGGGSGSVLEREGAENLPGYDDFYQQAGQVQQALGGKQMPLPGLNQYWGDQPFTVGPVYVGAFVCFLFLLGAFFVQGPLKWALLAATALSLLFAWGKNFQAATDFFIGVLPMYNKFRTVSSALVMAEFTIPLLAVLGLAEVIRCPQRFHPITAQQTDKIKLFLSFALTGGLSLALWLAPSLADSLLSSQEQEVFGALSQAGLPPTTLSLYRNAITEMRGAILSADAFRSFVIVALGCLALWGYVVNKRRAWLLCGFLTVLCGIDLWQVDKRYLNDEKFIDPIFQQEGFTKKTPADERILKDKGHYRVANLTADMFNENNTALFHKSIGGYHAAKLRRYQDLIDRHIQKETMAFGQAVMQHHGDLSKINTDSIAPVLNMLNTKYFIFGAEAAQVVENPAAAGNAWYIDRLSFVSGANAEMAALGKLNPKKAAVADEVFQAQLETAVLDSGRVALTQYAPNEMHYEAVSEKGGVVVFSEVYYPGWTATIDGQSVELGRANYLLRALRVPAGKHEIVLTFRPDSVQITETIAYVATALIFLLLAFTLYRSTRRSE